MHEAGVRNAAVRLFDVAAWGLRLPPVAFLVTPFVDRPIEVGLLAKGMRCVIQDENIRGVLRECDIVALCNSSDGKGK